VRGAEVRRVVMSGRRRNLTVLIVAATLVPLTALAAGCRLVGSGTLDYVPAAERPSPYVYRCPEPGAWYCWPAATNGSTVTMRVFQPDPGDAWPPPGQLGIWLKADRIPFLYNPFISGDLSWLALVRLPQVTDSPELQVPRDCAGLGATAGFVLVDGEGSNRVGRVIVNDDRTLSAWLTVPDTPENRHASWVLATDSVYLLGGVGGSAIRCGTVTVQ
jgi:hypothetical protein